MTATLTCSLDEFWRYLDPKIRNYVQSFTKSTKKDKGLICDECKNKVDELDSAHKTGRSRRDITKIILSDYETEPEKYMIPNLKKFFERIKKEHFPLEDNFRFLCKTCHNEYDKLEKNHPRFYFLILIQKEILYLIQKYLVTQLYNKNLPI